MKNFSIFFFVFAKERIFQKWFTDECRQDGNPIKLKSLSRKIVFHFEQGKKTSNKCIAEAQLNSLETNIVIYICTCVLTEDSLQGSVNGSKENCYKQTNCIAV